MKNSVFNIEIDKHTGYVKSIVLNDDPYQMNWCCEDGNWGRIHKKSLDWHNNILDELDGKKAELTRADISDYKSVSVYQSDTLAITVTRSFSSGGNFVENYRFKNITSSVLCINRDFVGIETPFSDKYLNSEECMTNRCNTHLWCGHNVTWINALKMGESNINLGLFLTKGAVDCYEQNGCLSNERGIFVLCPESIMLKSGEEYEIEWELFPHSGTVDFMSQIKKFDRYIGINAVHFTVFDHEDIEFTVESAICEKPQIELDGNNIETVKTAGGYSVKYHPLRTGKHTFKIRIGNISTLTHFMVKPNFKELVEKRVHFIIKNQQCLDPESPLYGAFLIYDNDYDSMYFNYDIPDHNACRERMNIALMLMKYLQIKEDAKVRHALDLYIKFVFREFYDAETGEVFNNIGKHSEFIRLYNAPGVMLTFCEMYFVTHDTEYLDHIMKLAETYYSVGGKKCYANGLAIGKVIKAFKEAGRDTDAERLMELFQTHVDNIISIGTAYPPHEVNYEQTIVTPAVSHISDMGILRDDKEYYTKEASKHLACLERFSGMQPDFRLNEIAIRYWDDRWFGKNRTMGDTLPHHLSVLTARAYIAFSRLSGKTEWLQKAEECLRNSTCLISDNGRGAAAYVYPYKLDGKRGEFFDPWSNDQDLVLYDAIYASEYMDVFKI